MGRLIVHMACPFSKLNVANNLAGLSGRANEHAIHLQSLPGKPAAIWDGVKGYPQGRWQGASQALAPEFVQTMFADAQTKKPESYYVAWDEATKTLVDTNLPAEPDDDSFDAFLAILGCERADRAEGPK